MARCPGLLIKRKKEKKEAHANEAKWAIINEIVLWVFWVTASEPTKPKYATSSSQTDANVHRIIACMPTGY